MDTLMESFPFVAAISLLVIGVVKLRQFLFIASFLLLPVACYFALIVDGSSGAFGFMGGFLLLFGTTCILLSRRVRPGSFVSGDGLVSTGALFLVLGMGGMMII